MFDRIRNQPKFIQITDWIEKEKSQQLAGVLKEATRGK
jgi:hypothetical protein